MAKYLVVASNPDMVNQAKSVAQMLHLAQDVKIVQISGTSQLTDEVYRAVRARPDVVISRGTLATVLEQNVPDMPPLVRIRLTLKEITDLLRQAIEISGKKYPKIAFCCSPSMIPAWGSLPALFNANLQMLIQSDQELFNVMDATALIWQRMEQFREQQYDVVIGGPNTYKVAKDLGMHAVYMTGTEDSMYEAFRVANQVVRSVEQQHRYVAELNTLLNHSTDGLVLLDNQGRVQNANRAAEMAFNQTSAQLRGVPLLKLVPSLATEMLQQVLEGGQSFYSLFFDIGEQECLCSLSPVAQGQAENTAIFSIQSREIQSINAEHLRLESRRRGLFSNSRFSDFPVGDASFSELMRRARTCAHTDSPVLIVGDPGTETALLAQCLHNESSRADGPLVRVNCAALDEEQQRTLMSMSLQTSEAQQHDGNPILAANHGTLVLENAESMSLPLQNTLLDYMDRRILLRGGVQPVPANTRIMALFNTDPTSLVRQGKLLPALYYRLSVQLLRLLPLSRRPLQLQAYLQRAMREYCTHYTRYLELSDDAEKALLEYPWPGNLTQLESFCEHLVIQATRRTVNRDMVMDSLYQLYHSDRPSLQGNVPSTPRGDPLQDAHVAQLVRLLQKHGGSRQAVADELGISRSSLWRMMKKYHLQESYQSLADYSDEPR